MITAAPDVCLTASRALVAVAARSLAAAGDEVTLPTASTMRADTAGAPDLPDAAAAVDHSEGEGCGSRAPHNAVENLTLFCGEHYGALLTAAGLARLRPPAVTRRAPQQGQRTGSATYLVLAGGAFGLCLGPLLREPSRSRVEGFESSLELPAC